MSESKEPKSVDVEPVYWHDCPALGPHTRVVESVLLDKTQTIVVGRQHRCVFCRHSEGEFVAAAGITPNPDGEGWLVDMAKAERVITG